MDVDFSVVDKMVELGASAADVLTMWKTHEEKRARLLKPETPRDRLFREGLLKLITMTGRTPPACRSFIGKCLKAAHDDPIIVMKAIEDAEERKVADAPGWIAGRLKKRDQSKVVHPADIDWDAILATYRKTGHWSRWGGPDPDSPACRAPRDLLVKYGLRAA